MRRFLFIVTIVFSMSLSLNAQGLFESLTDSSSEQEDTRSSSAIVGGYVRGVAYAGSEKHDFSSLFGEFSLTGRLSKGKTLFYGDVRVREGFFFNERRTVLDMKEAYAAYRGDKLSLYIGNQIISWGRTDGFNPTNNITPKDYFFLTPDHDDQLLSNFLVSSNLRFFGFFDIELIFIPVFRESNYRYNLFQMGSEARFFGSVLPERSIKNSGFGARLNFEFSSAGFSLSYFQGYDPFYGFRVDDIQFLPNVRVYYVPDFYKKNTIGFDIEKPLGSAILRAEMAYDITHDYEGQMHIPNPGLKYVLGIENNFSEIISIFQYIGQYTTGFNQLTFPVPPDSDSQDAMMQYGIERIYYESELFNRKVFSQQEKFNHAVMVSFQRFFAYDIIDIRLSGYYNITSKEYLVRPEMKWSLTDELSLAIGAHLMLGPENSVFYQSGKVLNGGFVSLKAGF